MKNGLTCLGRNKSKKNGNLNGTMEGLGHTKKNNKQRIVVCAQNSELFEHCVRWLKSFFIESHQANTVEYEFCFVSVIPQNKGDVCGVMAQGLGVPASLADC